MESFRSVEGKLLRRGVTTGSCAAAAAKAAVWMLLHQRDILQVKITTPKGVELALQTEQIQYSPISARCGIRKDAGDDPDVTHGLLICAEVKKTEEGFSLLGGRGVGRVTKPGLDQPPGEAAINSVPRKMIEKEVQQVCRDANYGGGIEIEISVPGGEEVAKRTFNPRLGITGGISIIGTIGIVEPMSHQAIVDTIRLEISQLRETGARRVLLTPGNYAEKYVQDELALSLKENVSCSNYIGEAMDFAVEKGFKKILLVGHIGKLIKLSIGMTNTHSSVGDGRMEALAACALEAGADIDTLKSILRCVTTDAALGILQRVSLVEETMEIVKRRVEDTLLRRLPCDVQMGCICFTKTEGLAGTLFMTKHAEELLCEWRK